MIIRKLATGLRRQDWFTVLLEVAVVVVGIIIGLQVDDWNERRKDSLKHDELLADLSAGLRSDLQELDGSITLQTLRYSAFSQLLDKAVGWQDPAYRYDSGGQRIETEIPLLDRTIPADEAIMIIQYLRSFDTDRHAYDGMVAMGDILILQDEDLVRDLQAHYLFIESINDVEKTIYKLTWEKIRNQLMSDGVGRSQELTWDEATSIVRGDKALIGALKAGAFEASDHTRFLKTIRSRTVALLRKIEPPDQRHTESESNQ